MRLARVVGTVLVAATIGRPVLGVTVTGSNGIHDIAVMDTGEYTARTGPMHPGPRGYSILYGGGGLTPLTTWNTVRSYASGTEYVLRSYSGSPAPGFVCESIDDYATPVITPIVTGMRQTGARTTWELDNGMDQFDVTQEVDAVGATFDDSVVKVQVCVHNRGASSASFGIRYLWDWQVGFVDGPYMGIRPPFPPTEPLLEREMTWISPAFDFYDISDTQSPTTSPPLYKVSGSVNGPVLTPAPSRPDTLEYADWPRAKTACFDYATGTRTIAGSGNDSSVVYLWGADPLSAISIAGGATTCVTAYLFAYTGDPPPLCAVTARVEVGPPACEPGSVTLDASTSTQVSCTGSLEYQFTDPSGAVARDWAASAAFDANEAGTWTVAVRCDATPSCEDTTTADVVVERPPAAFTVEARDSDPCAVGLFVEWPLTALGPWDPVTWGSNGAGTFSVHRSTSSCADARTSPPLEAGRTEAWYDDTTVSPGTTYYYVIVAEANASAVACPAGAERGAPFSEACLAAPISDVQTGTPSAQIGAALRVFRVGGLPHLDWTRAPALEAGENDVVFRSELARVLDSYATEILTRAYDDPAADAALLFYKVFRANACDALSDD